MRSRLHTAIVLALIVAALVSTCFASAYDAKPKLVVIVIIDQFPQTYLERWRGEFGPGGFNLFLERGAAFDSCYYDYASTHTAPGHSTLLTGAYVNGHGIIGNEWWDPQLRTIVTSVSDPATQLLGASGTGASPHNLLASTLGDELKLSTSGQARVFTISLKDRSAVLPGGHAADAAYWTDHVTGRFISSTFYMKALPPWVADFNAHGAADRYWDREWKNERGEVMGSTAVPAGKEREWYETVGATPFASEYELDFARALVEHEHLGSGPATDLLVISLSANDILGHKKGPNSPQVEAMTVATDRLLAGFFHFLDQKVGLANTWIALSADHGVGPNPEVAARFRFPQNGLGWSDMHKRLNAQLAATLGKSADYVPDFEWPAAFLDEKAFAPLKLDEEQAEEAVAEALRQVPGIESTFTKVQLAEGEVPRTPLGRKFENSYTPARGWYVLAIAQPYAFGRPGGADHFTPWSYDEHVPLAFYGSAFAPGTYRTRCEPIDLAATLSALLGIHRPSAASGRVLTEAIAAPHAAAGAR